jgi:hypothetical protein
MRTTPRGLSDAADVVVVGAGVRYVTDRIRDRAPEPDDERLSVSRPRTAKGSLRAGGNAMIADWREY